MSVARVFSRAQLGLAAPEVAIEVHLGPGLPGFSLVGLPAPVVRESRERVRAAIVNTGYDFPAGRITVNLAPVELSKEGGRFDLPIALGLLLASAQVRCEQPESFECYGELGLAGELKPVAGLFMAAHRANAANRMLLLPAGNCAEARLAGHRQVLGFSSLREVCVALAAGPDVGTGADEEGALANIVSAEAQSRPFSGIKGQWSAKRAMTVAAAGGHSLLMVGPPGSGKTLLASQAVSLLPPLSREAALEVAGIASIVSGHFDTARWGRIPWRAPHHSASASAMLGGGPRLQPGEITMAHRGVLFLDEFPEFDRRVLESLREPLESGVMTLARAAGHVELPAEFQLIAAMNPCPCGYYGDPAHECRCTPRAIQRYRNRISGPLLDRIDVRLDVPRPAVSELLDASGTAEACDLPAAVATARQRQLQRAGCLNARMSADAINRHCPLAAPVRTFLERSSEQLAMSARAVHRVLRVARTIADLAASDSPTLEHVAEALQLRRELMPEKRSSSSPAG